MTRTSRDLRDEGINGRCPQMLRHSGTRLLPRFEHRQSYPAIVEQLELVAVDPEPARMLERRSKCLFGARRVRAGHLSCGHPAKRQVVSAHGIRSRHLIAAVEPRHAPIDLEL